MKLKLGIVNVVSNELLEKWGYLALQEKNLRRVMGPEVELVIESGDNGVEQTSIESLFNPFFNSLDNRVILEKLFKLEQAGCDAVIVSCSLDPVLSEARSFLKIPIVGTVEASLLSACMAGPKFGFLVHRDRRCAEITEDLVVQYGLASRMTKMVYGSAKYDELVMDAFKNPQLVKEEILNGCREVIENGAHSVILGSTSLANLATACGISSVPEFDAPVFDPICVGAKMLEYRVGLQRALGIPPTSRAGTYRLFPKEFAKGAMQSFKFAC